MLANERSSKKEANNNVALLFFGLDPHTTITHYNSMHEYLIRELDGKNKSYK
jgi:hypothetical protein